MGQLDPISVYDSCREEFPASVLVDDLANGSKSLLTSVYVPMDRQRRRSLEGELDGVRSRWNGAWCIGEDWNVVRFPTESWVEQSLGGYEVIFGMGKLLNFVGPSSNWSIVY